jgi:1-acyl-sn-glycerol-3-phosphate acyltransferase
MAIPTDVRFVAKKVLQYVPFLGWYMWLARFVFIDRGNHRDAIRSLDAAADEIRKGVSIIVFPEGTRSEDRMVLPFKKGPFALAMKAGVPIGTPERAEAWVPSDFEKLP